MRRPTTGRRRSEPLLDLLGLKKLLRDVVQAVARQWTAGASSNPRPKSLRPRLRWRAVAVCCRYRGAIDVSHAQPTQQRVRRRAGGVAFA